MNYAEYVAAIEYLTAKYSDDPEIINFDPTPAQMEEAYRAVTHQAPEERPRDTKDYFW